MDCYEKEASFIWSRHGRMRVPSAPTAASKLVRRHSTILCVACVSAIAMLCCGADASRHNGAFGPADFGNEKNGFIRHEPDFAAIENIYKKGQLRSASVRKRINAAALPPESSSL